MRRRDVIAGLATLLVAPKRSSAQQAPAKLPRIGILSLAARPDTAIFDAFRKGLADLGYVDGQNIRIEYRLSAGDFSRLPAMAEELVRLPVDVIVIEGGATLAQIAREATPTIPIVGALGSDPVASGLAASLSHPGGNVTGFAGLNIELSGKRLQLLKEAFPAILRVAALWNPASTVAARRTTEEAARTLGVELRTIDVATPDQIAAGFESAAAGGAEALDVLADSMFWNERVRIVALAAKYRMPTIYAEPDYVDDGGLLFYGRSVTESFSRLATYVDKILKGTKPSDLPIEQPTKFELVVNLKTARALGLELSPSILARADEVIE